MKTLSTIEAMDAVQNTGEKMQTVFPDGRIWEMFSPSVNQGVRCIYSKGSKNESVGFLTTDANTMNLLWTLVRTPVPAWDAVEAYCEGKNVYYENPDGVRYHLAPTFSISVERFRNGTWYIEDEA